ncbi:MAG: YitT family protein [Lachnospiraceae bacterium]|nr:YitT family protein [Lachnospiraceae bacterium]
MLFTKAWKYPWQRTLSEYMLITLSIWVMVIGIYFFKFPNNFAFGGVTGFSTIVSKISRISAGDFTFVVNTGLLLIGFLFLGRAFGVKTVYASMLLSFSLSFLERACPMGGRTLTSEPLLELVFAVFLPAVGSAVLFNIGASSGGTDIIAMILQKHTSFHIGNALFLVDAASVVLAFLVFGVSTGLYSALGLLAKSMVIDGVIENINQCKCFSIVCDDPEPVCSFIIHKLNRSATVYEAQGAFTHHKKAVVMTTLSRSQAVRLRNYVRIIEPTAFIMITNSSEIIGKGFLTN